MRGAECGSEHEGRLTWAWYRPASLTTQPCPSSTACSAFISLHQHKMALLAETHSCMTTLGGGSTGQTRQPCP